MPRKSIPKIEQKCVECGNLFLAMASRVNRGLARFCTRQCVGAYVGRNGDGSSMEERFWRKVDKNGPAPEHVPELGRCWVWTAGVFRYPSGGIYGAFSINHQNQAASRVALSWQLGRPLGDGMSALHKCDNTLCVRNDGDSSHLFEGTQADNMADMVNKGRSLSGDRHPTRKLI